MNSDIYQASDMVQSGLPPANDRMLTTCFLAALFHALIILGVTFTGQGKPTGDAAAPLEVVLVNDQIPSVDKNPTAQYLAQRSQRGSGNTLKHDRTAIPKSSLMALDRPGVPNGDGLAAQQAGTDAGDDAVLATRAPSPRILYFASTAAAKEATQLPLLLEKRPDLSITPNDDGVELHMRGEASNQLWIAADTRESDVAEYLDNWRRKIERVGTMNFPDVARRRKLSGTPVIEVTIGANGNLLETTVKRSSGHVEIDEAAMRILKLSAPFDPFNGELSAKHDEIRIAYEWQFLGGASQGSNLLYAEPGH